MIRRALLMTLCGCERFVDVSDPVPQYIEVPVRTARHVAMHADTVNLGSDGLSEIVPYEIRRFKRQFDNTYCEMPAGSTLPPAPEGTTCSLPAAKSYIGGYVRHYCMDALSLVEGYIRQAQWDTLEAAAKLAAEEWFSPRLAEKIRALMPEETK